MTAVLLLTLYNTLLSAAGRNVVRGVMGEMSVEAVGGMPSSVSCKLAWDGIQQLGMETVFNDKVCLCSPEGGSPTRRWWDSFVIDPICNGVSASHLAVQSSCADMHRGLMPLDVARALAVLAHPNDHVAMMVNGCSATCGSGVSRLSVSVCVLWCEVQMDFHQCACSCTLCRVRVPVIPQCSRNSRVRPLCPVRYLRGNLCTVAVEKASLHPISCLRGSLCAVVAARGYNVSEPVGWSWAVPASVGASTLILVPTDRYRRRGVEDAQFVLCGYTACIGVGPRGSSSACDRVLVECILCGVPLSVCRDFRLLISVTGVNSRAVHTAGLIGRRPLHMATYVGRVVAEPTAVAVSEPNTLSSVRAGASRTIDLCRSKGVTKAWMRVAVALGAD